MHDQDAKKVVEAVLFSTSDVLTTRNIATIVGDGDSRRVRTLIDELNSEYESSSRTFRIQQIGDGFQLRTLPMYKTWITKIEPLRPIRLSRPALETLAIVAYRQPVTRAQVEHLRGVDSASNLRNLLDKRLVRIVGKDNAPGRPLIYGTTRHFLSLFNLTSLKDLPTLEDMDLAPALTPPGGDAPQDGAAAQDNQIAFPTSALNQDAS